MKIEDQYAVNSTAAHRTVAAPHGAATFEQAMAQAAASRKAQTTSSSSQHTTATSPTKTAYEELVEYMKKSPAQRWREKILRDLGLTEDQLAALPPEEKEKVEKEIAERMQKHLQENPPA